MIEIRKGQAPAKLGRTEFGIQFRAGFVDPAFRAEDSSMATWPASKAHAAR